MYDIYKNVLTKRIGLDIMSSRDEGRENKREANQGNKGFKGIGDQNILSCKIDFGPPENSIPNRRRGGTVQSTIQAYDNFWKGGTNRRKR